jgi:hypothetical protein
MRKRDESIESAGIKFLHSVIVNTISRNKSGFADTFSTPENKYKLNGTGAIPKMDTTLQTRRRKRYQMTRAEICRWAYFLDDDFAKVSRI